MSALCFLLFSTLECLSIFGIALSLFRYRIAEDVHYYACVSLLMSAASYWMWQIGGNPEYVPALSVLMCSLALLVRSQVSSGAAILMALTGYGYIVYGALQSTTLYAFAAMGWVQLERIQSNTSAAFLLQSANAALLFAISYVQYRKGFGFTFPLSWVRVQAGDRLLASLVCVDLAFVAAVFRLQYQVLVAAAAFAVLLILLLHALHRKERRHVRNLSQTSGSQDEAGAAG